MNKAKKAIPGTGKTNGRGRASGSNGARPSDGRNGSRVDHFKGPSELEEAIRRYSDLYEFAPVGYITFDRGGRIDQANLAACELLRAKRQYLVGAPFSLWVPREDLSLFLGHLVRCRAGESRVDTNLHLQRGRSESLFVLLSSTPTANIPLQGGRFFQTAIIDLTERERAEEALRAKEKELEQIVTQTPFMLTRCARDLRYRYVSHAYAKMVGLTAEQLAGKPIVEVLGKKALATIMPYIERALAGETVSYETAVPFQNKKPHFLHGVYVPDKDANGEIVGWIASIIDVTERKKAEAAAMRLAALVTSSHDAVVAKDLNGIITDWNESAQRIFGYEANEIIGKSILTLIPKDRHSEEAEILRKIRRGESIDHYQTIRHRKDGTLVQVSLTISPIRDPEGKIIGVSKIARDITEEKETEHQIAEQARLLNLTNEAILVRDAMDRVTYWNHGAEELYGFSAKEAIGTVSPQIVADRAFRAAQQDFQTA